MLSTRSIVTDVASSWSEHTNTSASNPESRSSISEAGRWWSAAATMDAGRAACTPAATEPRGGRSASISRPSFTSALAMQTTTLPANGWRTARTVANALSHGVATTITSASAALALSAPVTSRRRAGHRPRTLARRPPRARSASREPMVTASPDSASRTATPRPAGPVPPSIPTFMSLPSHNRRLASGAQWDFSTASDSWSPASSPMPRWPSRWPVRPRSTAPRSSSRAPDGRSP